MQTALITIIRQGPGFDDSTGLGSFNGLKLYNDLVGNPVTAPVVLGSGVSLASVPTGLTAVAQSSTQINLNWTPSTGTVAGYNIYRGGVVVGTSNTNWFNDTGLTAATTYTYKVSAYDTAGNNSLPSAVTSPITTLPGISNVTVSNITSNSATVGWYTDQVANTRPDYGPTPLYGLTGGQNDSVTVHSSVLTGLSPNSLYHFHARSNGAAYTTTLVSPDQTFTTEGGTALANIFSFTPTPANIQPGQSITLSWNVIGATSISIEDNWGDQIPVGSGTSVPVSPTQTTTYTLTATNTNGNSTATATVTVSNNFILPTNPSSFTSPNCPPATTNFTPSCPSAPPSNNTLATFTVPEMFGVSHPDQIIDFDYSGPYYPNMYMLNTNSVEVPYQVLSNGKIAVRTSLAANATETFTLMYGTNTATPDPQQTVLMQVGNFYQITNGVTGVRVLYPNGQTRSIPIASISVTKGVATVTTSVNNDLETAVTNPSWETPESAGLQGIISGVTGNCSNLNGNTYTLGGVSIGNIDSPTQVILNTTANCTTGTGGTLTVPETRLGPIQGILFKDGSWSPSGNLMEVLESGDQAHMGYSLNANNNITTTVVENGPIETVVKVSYQYTFAADDGYGNELLGSPQVPGYYNSTITLQAGQPSILIDENTNMDFDYKVNVYPNVQINQGQYLGHGALSAVTGYDPGFPPTPGVANSGTQCSGVSAQSYHECFRDFDPNNEVEISYLAGPNSTPYTAAWNPWGMGTGWIWQLYNKNGNVNSPVLGAFTGPASKAMGDNATGFSPYLMPANGSSGVSAGYEFFTDRRGPDNSIYFNTQYDWGIFVGTQGNDLPNPYVIPTINLQWNLHSGVNLNKIYRYKLDYSDPANGYGSLFNDPSMIQGLINTLRNGSDKVNFKSYLYSLVGNGFVNPLVNMWADPSGLTTHYNVVGGPNIPGSNQLANSMLNSFVNGEGIFTPAYSYWQGGLAMSSALVFMDSIMVDKTTSDADKALVRADASLFANILYDEDFVPLSQFGLNGLSAGTGNMPVQQTGYRNEFTLYLGQNSTDGTPMVPFLGPLVAGATSQADALLDWIVNPWGPTQCSPNYTAPCIEPTMQTLLQAKMAGIDYFAPAGTTYGDQPRIDHLGEFLMQWITPPDVRGVVGTNGYVPVAIPRKDIEEGDAYYSSHSYTGILAQGLRDTNLPLAARLMGAWTDAGQAEDNFTGPTVATININLPYVDPQLTSANFPGYMSVLRSGWETPQEDASWLINGDWLQGNTGHRHDDNGEAIIYAFQAPLSTNWASFYSPPTSGANMQSSVIPDTSYGPAGAWSLSGQTTAGVNSNWTSVVNPNYPGASSANSMFEAFSNSSMADSNMANTDGLTWQRKLYSLNTDPALPITMIKDDFPVNNMAIGKVMTWNLRATGQVTTPAGLITPPISFEENEAEVAADTLPSASSIFNLPAGVNQFKFTGQPMPNHPTKGIDWDLYTIADSEAQQAIIGNWGNAEANETQHILRVHGYSGFWTLILPYDKGTRPNLSVTEAPNVLVPSTNDAYITYNDKKIRVNEHYYSYVDSNQVSLTSFDASAVSNNSSDTNKAMTISGGPMEIVLAVSAAKLTFHGAVGLRTFTLPSANYAILGADPKFTNKGGNSYTYDYEGTAPVTISLSTAAITTAPSVPMGIIVTALSPTQNYLTWLASTDPNNVAVAGYNIYRNGTKVGTSATNNYSDTGGAAASTYTVSAYDAAGNTSGQSGAVTIGPAFVTHPANQTVNSGESATFRVMASGVAPMTYQWQKNGINIAGANAVTYNTPATTAANSGTQYDCIVTNASGSATSNAATLTVSAADTTAPSVPTGLIAIAYSPTQVNLSWNASTDNIGVAGYKIFVTNGTNSKQVGNTSNNSYIDFRAVDNGVPSIPTSPANSYSVSAYDAAGNNSAQSALVNVGVSIAAQPANQTVNVGTKATLTVTALGAAPLTYQWYVNNNPVGTNSATYTTPALTAGDNGSSITVVVSNPVNSVISSAAILSVNVAPFITTQPLSQTVIQGMPATFSVAASGAAPLTYQWYLNGGIINGATSASYTTPATQAANNGNQYNCVVTNALGFVPSNPATLTVNSTSAAPVITTPPVSVSVAATTTAQFSIVASGIPAPTYQWMQEAPEPDHLQISPEPMLESIGPLQLLWLTVVLNMNAWSAIQ